MPKDNETVPFPFLTDDGPSETAGPQSFALDQMVRCEQCLRANPPTRVNCLYCAAVLPLNETTIKLQKPALRPLEKWERGYNNILLPSTANLTDAGLAEAADALKLAKTDLSRIVSLEIPLPLARAATMDEASLVQFRLARLELNTLIVPDAELGLDETAPIKVRAIGIDDNGFWVYQTPEIPATRVSWPNVLLIVTGRLIVKRVELKEQKAARAENRILDASEFFTDESVLEIYASEQAAPYRIAANSFDFSCLENQKTLIAGENISALVKLFRDYAPNAVFDESFNSVRKALEAVWPSEQQNETRGWRRERPGKYSIGSVNEISNESQFLRYSRLRYHLLFQAKLITDAKPTTDEDS